MSTRCISIILCRLERLNLLESVTTTIFRHFRHPSIQAGLIFIMGADPTLKIDGIDAKNNMSKW